MPPPRRAPSRARTPRVDPVVTESRLDPEPDVDPAEQFPVPHTPTASSTPTGTAASSVNGVRALDADWDLDLHARPAVLDADGHCSFERDGVRDLDANSDFDLHARPAVLDADSDFNLHARPAILDADSDADPDADRNGDADAHAEPYGFGDP